MSEKVIDEANINLVFNVTDQHTCKVIRLADCQMIVLHRSPITFNGPTTVKFSNITFGKYGTGFSRQKCFTRKDRKRLLV